VPSKDVVATTPKEEQIKWLTLCAMQETVKADIAFLQKRDFFPTLPGDVVDLAGDVDKTADAALQISLTGLLEGDFLVVSHVPGSVIQKIMSQSKAFRFDDRSYFPSPTSEIAAHVCGIAMTTIKASTS